MRITKTRLMRGKTINPNPPICKSKEPSFTHVKIYSCSDKHLVASINEYNLNYTQAAAIANGGQGTFSEGYFYEAAFKKTTSLSQKHCPPTSFLNAYPNPHRKGFVSTQMQYEDETNGNIYLVYTSEGQRHPLGDPASWTFSDIRQSWDTIGRFRMTYTVNGPTWYMDYSTGNLTGTPTPDRVPIIGPAWIKLKQTSHNPS